jgi:hypothetical protein
VAGQRCVYVVDKGRESVLNPRGWDHYGQR